MKLTKVYQFTTQVLDGQFTEAVELPVEFEVAVEGMDVNQIFCEVRIACASWLHMHQKVWIDLFSSFPVATKYP